MTTSGFLSKRLTGVSESATLKLNALVQSMKTQGIPVINLTAGEPDFNVPDAAKEAVIEAVKANRSKYTPAPGIPELREAIALKTNRQQPTVAGIQPWKASDTIVTNGGKQALFNSFMALLDPGDEVLIPSPYWLSYPEMVKLAGGIPKFIGSNLKSGFKITPADLTAAITPKVKILVLNSPSNPTGAMYSRDEFAALGEVLTTHPGVWVVSDEIYDRICFGEVPFCSFLESTPGLRDRTITVNGMSKSAAMTGWRIGWSVAPAEVTAGMNTLQGQSTSGINALAQWASLAALKLPETDFDSQVKTYLRRRNIALEILGKTRKIDLFAPQGAFYLFVGVRACLGQGEDSGTFAENLLQNAQVAVVPGTPFGDPESVRLSFATDERSLLDGCERIVRYVNQLSGEQDVLHRDRAQSISRGSGQGK